MKVKIIKIDGKDVKVYMSPLTLSVKSVDGEQGIVEAYVSVFGNVDSYGDIVEPGAFAESIAKKLPKVLFMHDWNEVIGKVIEAREDEKGLYVKMQLVLDVQRAKETLALLKAKAIDEFSFGYVVEDSEVDADGHRRLKKIWIYEVSPVLVGANPETELISAKSAYAEEKETVAEVLSQEEIWKRKRENMKRVMEIMDAFWEAYFSENTPVEAFGSMVQEVVSLLTPLISASKDDSSSKVSEMIGKAGKNMPVSMADAVLDAAKQLSNALEAVKATEDVSEEVEEDTEKKDGSHAANDMKIRAVTKEVRKSVKALNAALHVIKH